MTRLFLALYHWFSGHKAILYTTLAASSIFFGWFAFKLDFEENILALLPKTEKSEECAVAFGSIKQKDKLFIEIVSRNGGLGTAELSAAMDDFTAILASKDETGYFSNVFCTLDQDDLMNIVYYLMGALPCHVPADAYPVLDSLMEDGRIEQMIASGAESLLPSMGYITLADGHLFSGDKTTALAFLTPSFDVLDTKTGNGCVKMLTSCIKEFEDAHPQFEVLYHGALAEGNFNSIQTKKDLVKTVGISMILICLLLCVCLRSKRTIIHLIVPIAYGTLFSMACIYWIKGSMSFIAMGIAALVLGIAFSYCLHVIIHYKFVGDVEKMLREETKPVCLGCITTIGAFVGLLFTSSELLRDFGLFASLALTGITFYALAFLPHFLGEDDTLKNERAFEFVNKVNDFPIDRKKSFIIPFCLVIAVCIVMSGKVKFDSDLANIGHREPRIVRSEQLYSSKVNDSHFSEYLAVNADDLDSAIKLSTAMGQTLDSLKKAGVIYGWSGTQGLLVSAEEQEGNIRRWKEYWTPEKIEKACNILQKVDEEYDISSMAGMDIPMTLRLMAQADYQPQSLYDSGIVPEGLMSNFVEYGDFGWLVFANALMDMDTRWEVCDKLSENGSLVVLDPFYYAGDMVNVIHEDFKTVLLVSSIFVFLVLLLQFKSLLLALVGFMPMFLSWYVVQGVMAMAGIEFNLINIMISTFIFGVGVDYSIFMMQGLVRKAGGRGDELLDSHKTAIFFSAVILVIVTASLLFAKHPALYSVGISTIIGMVSTILMTYALQPLFFRLLMRNDKLRKLTLHEK